MICWGEVSEESKYGNDMLGGDIRRIEAWMHGEVPEEEKYENDILGEVSEYQKYEKGIQNTGQKWLP